MRSRAKVDLEVFEIKDQRSVVLLLTAKTPKGFKALKRESKKVLATILAKSPPDAH